MAKSESGRGKFVGDARIEGINVLIGVAFAQRPQSKGSHQLGSDNQRHPFFVNDMLILSNDNPSGFLEQPFIAPLGMLILEEFGQAIMLPHPNGMHDNQVELFIGSDVTGKETFVTFAAHGDFTFGHFLLAFGQHSPLGPNLS